MKYLAVNEDGQPWIEDSVEAVNHAIVNKLAIKYYWIALDEFNKPTLEEVTDVSRTHTAFA